MPRKAQGWITFQSSEEERQMLEQICQQTQRSKTEVLRELLRQLGQSPSIPEPDVPELAVELAHPSAGSDPDRSESALPAVKISARNLLPAIVKQVVKGTVNAEVTLTIAPGVELVSIITRASAERLGLVPGKSVFAVIKSSSVMIAEG